MGQSTDGQICFGCLFDEDYEFPWDADKYEGSIEDWWRDTRGFKSAHPIHDEQGKWIGGTEPTKEQYAAFFGERREWDEANPLPVKLVNVQHTEYPVYILAVPSTCKTANRGYPVVFIPSELDYSVADFNDLVHFLTKYNIDASDPQWYLSSYWG